MGELHHTVHFGLAAGVELRGIVDDAGSPVEVPGNVAAWHEDYIVEVGEY